MKKNLFIAVVTTVGTLVLIGVEVFLSDIPSQAPTTILILSMIARILSVLFVVGTASLIYRKWEIPTQVKPKTAKVIRIIAILFLVVGFGLSFVVFMYKQNNLYKQNDINIPSIAMENGWLFEIKEPSGVHEYLILDDGIQVKYLTETEIFKALKTDNWDEWIKTNGRWPLELWVQNCEKNKKQVQPCSQKEFDDGTKYAFTFEEWRIKCENYNQKLTTCSLMPYEKYQTLMENYLRDNKIDGSIKDSYIISIPSASD